MCVYAYKYNNILTFCTKIVYKNKMKTSIQPLHIILIKLQFIRSKKKPKETTLNLEQII